MNDLISIVVPVFGVESVVHYCVDSILKQSYTFFELIIVDDGSLDQSGIFCDNVITKDSRVVVIHQKNKGVSSARNLGIAISLGKYITFVDSDDIISNDFLKSLISLKKEYANIDNIWCGFQVVNGYNCPQIISKSLSSETQIVSMTSRRRIMDLHEKRLDAGPVCKLYSAEIIQSMNLKFDTNLSLGEDLIFNFQYLDITDGKICILNSCLYNYVCKSDNSLTRKFHSGLFEKYIDIHNVIFNCMKRWNCDNQQFKSFYNACFFIYDFVLRNTFHKNSNITHKLKYNKKIMQSNEFQNTLNHTDCFIHPVYRFVYKHSLSLSYRMLNVLENIR